MTQLTNFTVSGGNPGGMAMLPVMAFAQGGHVGGGDTCRNEISKHRETLYQWIQSGDASDLDFSQSKTDVRDFAEYRKRMLKTLSTGEVVVTCYLDPARIQDPAAQKIAREQGVSYRAITLTNPDTGQVEPTACINYEDQTGVSHIDCNYDSIVNQKALDDPNYQLTHHEYASIAGVELRKTDSEPDFTISRQLSQYEQWVKVKKLGKKVFTPTTSSTDEYRLYCVTDDYLPSYGVQGTAAYRPASGKSSYSMELFFSFSGLKGNESRGVFMNQLFEKQSELKLNYNIQSEGSSLINGEESFDFPDKRGYRKWNASGLEWSLNKLVKDRYKNNRSSGYMGYGVWNSYVIKFSMDQLFTTEPKGTLTITQYKKGVTGMIDDYKLLKAVSISCKLLNLSDPGLKRLETWMTLYPKKVN